MTHDGNNRAGIPVARGILIERRPSGCDRAAALLVVTALWGACSSLPQGQTSQRNRAGHRAREQTDPSEFESPPAATRTAGALASDEVPQPAKQVPVTDRAAPVGDPRELRGEPWRRGVSVEQRHAANRQIQIGNELFLESRYREALHAYQNALALWDHPAIYFNVARVLIQLDRPVEAYESIERTLRYGCAPLQPRVCRDAPAYRRLLRGQVGELHLSCRQTEVRITIDGRQALTCPGTRTKYLAPGHHQIVGTRPEFLTATQTLLVVPGRTESIDIELVPLKDAMASKPRWPTLQAWPVVTTGVIFSAIGLMLRDEARFHFTKWGALVEKECSKKSCNEGTGMGLYRRAEREERAAAVSFIAGGTLIAAGLTVAILNRSAGSTRALDPDQGIKRVRVGATARVSRDYIGAAFRYDF